MVCLNFSHYKRTIPYLGKHYANGLTCTLIFKHLRVDARVRKAHFQTDYANAIWFSVRNKCMQMPWLVLSLTRGGVTVEGRFSGVFGKTTFRARNRAFPREVCPDVESSVPRKCSTWHPGRMPITSDVCRSHNEPQQLCLQIETTSQWYLTVQQNNYLIGKTSKLLPLEENGPKFGQLFWVLLTLMTFKSARILILVLQTFLRETEANFKNIHHDCTKIPVSLFLTLSFSHE